LSGSSTFVALPDFVRQMGRCPDLAKIWTISQFGYHGTRRAGLGLSNEPL